MKKTINNSSILHKFVAVNRWEELFTALTIEIKTPALPEIDLNALFAVILVSIAPVVLTCIESIAPSLTLPLSTIAFGVSTLLAMALRERLGLKLLPVTNWHKTLSITHTAFALGCIPAVIILALEPDLLANRHDIFMGPIADSAIPASRPSLIAQIGLIAAISAWIAITEEVIFRGLLVSALRRWKGLSKQIHRDLLAITCSSILFGIAHYFTWGPLPALALVGLGLGFVIGYIANGERLIPLVLYHFIFDFLSIGLSVLLQNWGG